MENISTIQYETGLDNTEIIDYQVRRSLTSNAVCENTQSKFPANGQEETSIDFNKAAQERFEKAMEGARFTHRFY